MVTVQLRLLDQKMWVGFPEDGFGIPRMCVSAISSFCFSSSFLFSVYSDRLLQLFLPFSLFFLGSECFRFVIVSGKYIYHVATAGSMGDHLKRDNQSIN